MESHQIDGELAIIAPKEISTTSSQVEGYLLLEYWGNPGWNIFVGGKEVLQGKLQLDEESILDQDYLQLHG